MKQIFIIFILLLLSFGSVYANPQFLDLDSSFALQDVPVYQGTEEFMQKIDFIRKNEGREPLGLVLCGGSARAFAHIGVLKALEENNVKPDFIVANSMGAIIGLLYAYGFSPDKILEIIQSLNLTSYFEPVVPTQGGVISVRNFRSLINTMLGKDYTDVSECVIPIIVLTEDLKSKRQVFHSNGDFSKVMTAAFAMPAIMEYIKFITPEGERLDLFDSGSIDLGGIEIASRFSDNLIVSSAFYNKKVNYNNPVVFLSRMNSVAKERAVVEDLKTFAPLLIRNNVEDFSFMAFDKSEELSLIGHECALKVMDYILECPHGNADISERRKETDVMADNLLDFIKRDKPLEFKEFYAGIKIWPSLAAIEFPDSSLYEKNGISVFGFADMPHLYARLGVEFPFGYNSFSAESFIRFVPASFFESDFFAQYSFSYDRLKPVDFYALAKFIYKINYLPEFFKALYLNAEIRTSYDFIPQEMFYTAGLDTGFLYGKKFYFSFKPDFFMSGKDFKELSGGAGLCILLTYNFDRLGFSDSFSGRYALFNIKQGEDAVTKMYKSDFYRGTVSSDFVKFIAANASEIYFVNFNPDISFAELLIFKQFKLGAFFDFYFDDCLTCMYMPGAFGRTNISLVGLCDFIFEAGGGYEVRLNKPVGYFKMKSRM